MKLSNIITGILAAGLFSGVLSAQQGDPAATLNAIVQMKNNKAMAQVRLVQPPTVAKGVVRIIPLGQGVDPTPRDMQTKDFQVLMVMTPPELAEARRVYAEGNLSSAKRLLAATRTKYADFSALPESPSVQAAHTELRCLARLLDWAGLGKAVEAFPHPNLQSSADRAVLAAARLLSQVSDDPATAAARLKEIEAMLADSGKMKNLHSTEYGWLKYAQARALESGLPADTIPADKQAQAYKAVDAFCEAAVCYRGSEMEIAADALRRAFNILWAMPGVKPYANAARQMDAKKWSEAPADFREAVALANMLTTVISPEIKDNSIQNAAAFFVNTQEGKRPASAAAPAEKK